MLRLLLMRPLSMTAFRSDMGAMQRRKGAAGEREAAAELRAVFPQLIAERSARNGVDQAEDICHSLTGVHIEVKRCETLSLYAAMEQAQAACGGKVPVIMHRRNRKEWLAVVPFKMLPVLAALIDTALEHADTERYEEIVK